MRRRERAFALVLGTICTLSMLAGAWPLPLLAFALLELGYTAVERACTAHAGRAGRTRTAPDPYRRELAGGILRGTP